MTVFKVTSNLLVIFFTLGHPWGSQSPQTTLDVTGAEYKYFVSIVYVASTKTGHLLYINNGNGRRGQVHCYNNNNIATSHTKIITHTQTHTDNVGASSLYQQTTTNQPKQHETVINDSKYMLILSD